MSDSGNASLDVVTRYQICRATQFLQLQSPEDPEDPDGRQMAAMGLSGISLAIVFLREPYEASGGQMAALEAHPTSAQMKGLVRSVQTDASLRAHVTSRCQALVGDLLREPLRELRR